MSKINIVAKATSVETAKDKKSKGAGSIEWQIIGGNEIIPHAVLDILPITSVHTLLDGERDVCLNDCVCLNPDYEENNKLLLDAFRAAEYAGEQQGTSVKVVVHLRDNVFPTPYPEIANTMSRWLRAFPHCDFAIEHNMMFGRTGIVRTACEPDSVPNFIKNIQLFLSAKYKDRIGSVVDTCHAASTIRIKNSLLKTVSEDCMINPDEEMDRYFSENSDVCSILHFSDVINFGLKPEEHGVAFADPENFKATFSRYLKILPQADFVIEMREDDYSNAKNFAKTVREINAYFKAM